jgi:hypothetical protein
VQLGFELQRLLRHAAQIIAMAEDERGLSAFEFWHVAPVTGVLWRHMPKTRMREKQKQDESGVEINTPDSSCPRLLRCPSQRPRR